MSVASDLVAQIMKRTSDSGVAPARVVAGHPDDQALDVGSRLGATGPARLTPIVFPGDELPVPAEQRVWGDQSADFE